LVLRQGMSEQTPNGT